MKNAAKQAIVDWYRANMSKTVQLGSRKVKVLSYDSENRQGSYERGLKWSRNTWGYLMWQPSKGGRTQYSGDHGQTWYDSFHTMIKNRKGKIRLENNTSKEFAFDSIQDINRRYYGPGYEWKP